MKVKEALMISRLVDKLELTIEDPTADAGTVGTALLMQILSKVHKAEKEVCQLISILTGCKESEALDEDVFDLFDRYKDEGILSFFTSRVNSAIQES